MARKTAIRITGAEVAAEQQRQQERADRAAAERARERARQWLPTLPETRDAQSRLDEGELLDICRSAARLEMRGANYSADDRADCASEVMRRLLLDNGGRCPRRDDPHSTLTYLCGQARNLRDSLDRQRARDQADADRAAQAHALTPDALGAGRDDTPAKHAAIVARYGEDAAERAVAAVLALLFPAPRGSIAATYRPAAEARALSMHPTDSPVWLTLYGWVTGRTSEQIAERRRMSRSLVAKRQVLGARFLREFWTAEQLGDLLTLGATRAEGRIDLCMADLSREAPHSMAADIAEHFRRNVCWREGTAHGRRPDRPENAEQARAACDLTRLSRQERVHWRNHRARHAEEHRAEQAAALRRLGRLAALGRREQAVAATSELARATVAGA